MTQDHKTLIKILTQIIERGDTAEIKEILEAETLLIGLDGIKQKLGGPPAPVVSNLPRALGRKKKSWLDIA
jgi:hypothetical protein